MCKDENNLGIQLLKKKIQDNAVYVLCNKYSLIG